MTKAKWGLFAMVALCLTATTITLLADITAISTPNQGNTYNRNSAITTSGTFDGSMGAITVEIRDSSGNVMNSGTAAKDGSTWSATINPPTGACWEANQDPVTIRVSQGNSVDRAVKTNNTPDPCP